MITPSFSLTATERVLPKLALDFTTAALDSRITFTRTTGASNPATYVNSSGLITAATNNEPRFDYDPVTLVCKGLLIEESRINSQINSEDFSSWGQTNVSVVADDITSPDGTQNADKITDDATTGIHRVAGVTTISFTSGSSYTISVFAKAGTATVVQLTISSGTVIGTGRANFNLATGTLGTVSGGSATITDFGNGWHRCTFTFTSAGTTTAQSTVVLTNNDTNAARNASYSGDGQYLYIWGAQLEAGAFATSYIPTTTTALTRNADVATMTGTNFSDWFNASEGTFAIQASSALSITNSYAAFVNNSGTSIANALLMRLRSDSTANFTVRSGGADQAFISSSGVVANAVQNFTSAYKLNSFASCRAGGSVGADALGNLPVAPAQMSLGSLSGSASSFLNGHLQKLAYYPQRLTNAEVQAFSK